MAVNPVEIIRAGYYNVVTTTPTHCLLYKNSYGGQINQLYRDDLVIQVVHTITVNYLHMILELTTEDR